MCGFLGHVSNKLLQDSIYEESNQRIICRGPDEKVSKIGKLSPNINSLSYKLIFNRLSILDLTNLASQPMHSQTFDTDVVFNGEIYNHLELRKELEKKGVKFQSNHSDTEVVLNGLSYFGKNFLNKLVGQFSIVFIDRKKGILIFARDRLGQKPLFYNIKDNDLFFSSDMKVVSEISKNNAIDLESLSIFLKYSVVPSPKTIYKNIYKVKPGELIEFSLENGRWESHSEIFWNPLSFIDEAKFIEDEFEEILDNSVNIRTKADVPIATFLSGGIDSTSLVKRQFANGEPLNTFSVSYQNKKYDESYWFDKVAKRYSTNHKVVEISNNIKIEDIFSSIQSLGEPYSDPSVLPSYLISKEISHQYKVAISGDGGDELFGGYARTNLTLNRKKILFNSALYKIYPPILGTGAKIKSKSKNVKDAYSAYLEDQKFLDLLGIKTKSELDLFHKEKLNTEISDFKKLLLSDYKFFLPEMMLLKVDKTSMANSVEVRSPYVDHRLVEYIMSHKVDLNNFSQKKYLKTYISQDFDSNFINRKKMGFVFNLENFIYLNKEFVLDQLNDNQFITRKNLNKLYKYKSRMNANRIWKMLTLDISLKGK